MMTYLRARGYRHAFVLLGGLDATGYQKQIKSIWITITTLHAKRACKGRVSIDKDMKKIYRDQLDHYQFTFLSLIPGTKIPSVPAWAKFNKRRPTEAEQAELLSRSSESLAILVGKPYGIVVLDIDSLDSLPLVEQLGELPETLRVKTHRGYHYYFRCESFGNFEQHSRQIPDIELKYNGYVVAPGSVHPEGAMYEIVSEPVGRELPVLPEWIADLFRKGKGTEASHALSRSRLLALEANSLEDLTKIVASAQEGNRNNTLYRASKALRKICHTISITVEQGIEALLEATTLPESEAIRTIESGLGNSERLRSRDLDYFYPKVEVELLRNWQQLDPLEFGQDQSGMADWLCALYGKFIRYDHTVERWYIWTGKVWQPDETMAIRRIFTDAVYLREEATDSRRGDAKKDDLAKTYQFLRSMKSLSAMKSVLELAQGRIPIACKNSDWDRDPDLLCVQNGVVNLRTKVLTPACPDQMLSRITRFEYTPDAQYDLWDYFTDSVTQKDNAYQMYLRRAAGYSITGRTDARAFFMLFGSTTNGKSVFLDTIKHVMGSYASTTAWETFDYEQRNSHSQSLARLEGLRMVSVGEGSRESRWNLGRIKSITGNEDITARDMYKNDRNFKPVCKLWFALNSKPSLMDDSAAFWQRLILMPFHASFENAKIHGIEDMLKAEGEAVLRWLIDGAYDYYQSPDLRVGMPDVVFRETEEYKNESDPLGEFLDEYCVLQDDKQVKSSDLVKAYTEFCYGRGRSQQQRLSDRALTGILKKRFASKKASDANYYLGIGLRVAKQVW